MNPGMNGITISREEFLAALQDQARANPVLAARLAVADPVISASVGAMASMLAMLSRQIDLMAAEAFSKTRDSTVLADAAMKGILPFARPARLALRITNNSAGVLNVTIGRRILDHMARVYVCEEAQAIPAFGQALIRVRQKTLRTLSHTVRNSSPFYRVQIPAADDPEILIAGLAIALDGVPQPFTPEFANLAPGAAGYALEVDELQTLWAVFGWQDVFGIQPANGSSIGLQIEETAGEVSFPDGVHFAFEWTASQADASANITLEQVLYAGAGYVDIATLRDWARYQSTHDASAVYLGDFDALIRRNLPQIGFLSVWNEQIEEKVRGPSSSHINTLFIACSMDGVDEIWLRQQVTQIVQAADDSYRLRFIAPVETVLALTIRARIAAVHDVAATQTGILAVVLDMYGPGAQATRRGMLALNLKRLHAALLEQVAALQGEGSDFQIELPPQAQSLLPEQRRYVRADSVMIEVTQATYNDGQWSH